MQIKPTYLLFPGLILCLMFAGCSKSDQKPNPIVPPPVVNIPNKPDTTEDVYIVGNIGYYGGYWKNSQFIPLAMSAKYSFSADMAFSGNDIYVAGSIGDSIGYWKNGHFNFLTLSGDSLTPICIALINQDIYILLQLEIGLWNGYLYKNNTLYSPLATINQPGRTNMYTSGTDLYIPGTDLHIPSNALYWKNGVPIQLPDNGNGARAYGVCLNGPDIYAAGSTFNAGANTSLATWWKNGIPANLTDTSTDASADFISSSNGNIYVAGSSLPGNQFTSTGVVSAIVWKNGVATILTPAGYSERVMGLAVYGSDVYVSVTSYALGSSNPVSRYYKNGTPIYYTGTTGGYGGRIFVRPR